MESRIAAHPKSFSIIVEILVKNRFRKIKDKDFSIAGVDTFNDLIAKHKHQPYVAPVPSKLDTLKTILRDGIIGLPIADRKALLSFKQHISSMKIYVVYLFR